MTARPLPPGHTRAASPQPYAMVAAAVRAGLADLLDDDDLIDQWMTGNIPVLGNRRPVDLIADGEGQRVLHLIEAIKDGAFL